MRSEDNASVPPRLGLVFARWAGHSRPPQPPTGWNLPAWRAFLPFHEEFLRELPNPIDRAAVMARASGVDDEAGAVEGFLAAMVWGYGRVGYGPFRTARVLTENPDAAGRLLEAAIRVRRDGGPQAFAWLANNRLNWLGVAFATKYLFFCGGPPTAPALVLDRLVGRWLREHADWRIRLDWHAADYRRYVEATVGWASKLGAFPADVEYLMFADAVAQDPGNQWADPVFTGDAAIAGRQPPRVRPGREATAVLEALDDAAETFAALPGGLDRDDVEDFERGLRELRRIVLARLTTPPTS